MKKNIRRKKIIEVTNEIDNSKYLENLLQQYQMPTLEIIYIVSFKRSKVNSELILLLFNKSDSNSYLLGFLFKKEN